MASVGRSTSGHRRRRPCGQTGTAGRWQSRDDRQRDRPCCGRRLGVVEHRNRPRRQPPWSGLVTGLTMVSAVVVVTPLALPSSAHSPGNASREAWAGLVYGSTVGMVVAMTLWGRSVSKLGPKETMTYIYLEPASVVVIAAVLLGNHSASSRDWCDGDLRRTLDRVRAANASSRKDKDVTSRNRHRFPAGNQTAVNSKVGRVVRIRLDSVVGRPALDLVDGAGVGAPGT